MPSKLLGIAGSPRNVINTSFSPILVDELKKITSKEVLFEYLRLNSELDATINPKKSSLMAKDILGLSNSLRKKGTQKGMSNSEVPLVAALWEANRKGVDIDYLSLKDFFLTSIKLKKLGLLKEKLIHSDAVLLSGPVYFGDRSSLVQELINFIRLDKDLLSNLFGKLYAGISVGAKRNGGQETTLIYQILDFISLGLLAVGNDSDTTAQYGGTCWAGNVGSINKDGYGIDTSMGTGRRLANLLVKYSYNGKLNGKIKILFIILQDGREIGKRYVNQIIKKFSSKMDAEVLDVTQHKFIRCLACNTCPHKFGIDEEYRCKIGKADNFYKIHKNFLDHDAIVPVAVSLNDFSVVQTNYQVFMERTRYLRRGDYVLSDMMLSPLLFQELGNMENLQTRMITSLIRHHTVVSKPIVGHLINDTLIDLDNIYKNFDKFLTLTKRLTIARLSDIVKDSSLTRYNPIGYVLDVNNGKRDQRLEKRRKFVKKRMNRLVEKSKKRLIRNS
jgi:multimeric flavodoxin WrbA